MYVTRLAPSKLLGLGTRSILVSIRQELLGRYYVDGVDIPVHTDEDVLLYGHSKLSK